MHPAAVQQLSCVTSAWLRKTMLLLPGLQAYDAASQQYYFIPPGSRRPQWEPPPGADSDCLPPPFAWSQTLSGLRQSAARATADAAVSNQAVANEAEVPVFEVDHSKQLDLPTAEPAVAEAVCSGASGQADAPSATSVDGPDTADGAPAADEWVRGPMPRNLWKYWMQRYTLFARFDDGVLLDVEGWFSVTPEAIARWVLYMYMLCMTVGAACAWILDPTSAGYCPVKAGRHTTRRWHTHAVLCSRNHPPTFQACHPSCRHHARRCACDTLLDPFAGVGGNVIQMAATCQRVIAGELSPERTSLIRHNADVYGVADRIESRCCDFWDSSSPAEVCDIPSGSCHPRRLSVETVFQPDTRTCVRYSGSGTW
jgi:RNA cap guanine-N2 methyltransferase